MKIVSFNVNGVRARQHQLEAIKNNLKANIVGLQEVKATPEQFPYEDVESIGWKAEVHSQKAHYGVATLSDSKAVTVQDRKSVV